MATLLSTSVNGTLIASDYVQSTLSMYSPIYYDGNDSSFYLDANSTSRLYATWNTSMVYVGGSSAGSALNINFDQIWTNSGNLHLQYSGSGNIDMNYGGGYAFSRTSLRAPIFYDYQDSNYYIDPNGSSYLDVIDVRNSWIRNAIYFGGGNNYLTWDGAGISSNVHIQSNSSLRAPIFYDSNDTTYYLDPSTTATSLNIAGGINQQSIVGRPYAVWGAAGGVTGAVVIKFPGDANNYGMVHAVIDIYEYNSNAACTVIVGGHNWDSRWYAYNANVVGQTDKQVRLGFKDGKYCIVIGDGNSSWSYGQVVLRKIQNGTYYQNVMNVSAGYTAAIESDTYSWISEDLRALRSPGNIFMAGNVVATQAWVTSQGYLSSIPSNYVTTAGGQTIGGITYFSNNESMQVYGIRGRFANEYIHLYNKVGIGHPNGWGEGQGNTPAYGLSTYGGINIAYGNGASSSFNGYVRIDKNWAGGDYGAEQFTIRGTYPSITLRSTTHDTKWLIHHASSLQFYQGDGVDNNGWDKRLEIETNGNIWMSWAGDWLSNLLGAKLNVGSAVLANGTSSGNIDDDWGQSFKTFDPIPSGTPPMQSPNIRTINIGDNFNRKTQLAFNYESDRSWFRRRTEAGWQTWREFIHSGNIADQSVSVARQLLSPNNTDVVAADSAMPNAASSFIHTLALGPSNNDGHILGMTWQNSSIYGAQIFLDTDPTDTMAIRSRSSTGAWTSWKTVMHSGNIGSQSVNYASSAGNADTVDGYHTADMGNRSFTRRGFTVNGEGNIYYPVLIPGSAAFAFNRYSINRHYAATAPWDPIGTGVHKGGLTFDFEWSGDPAWGGNDHTLRVVQFSETYTTMVAGLALPVTGGVCVWLRGGGASYDIQVDGSAVTPTVYIGNFTAANGVVYSPRTDTSNVNSEIYGRMPVRSSSELYDNGNRVITTGNISSQSVSYASSAGALTSMDISQFTNNSGYVNNTQIVPINLIQVTRTELLTLISNNELITNAHYEISGVCDYYFKDSTITLQAISSSTLNPEGIGKFYVPIYPNSTFKNIWNDIKIVNLTNISGTFYDNEPISLSTGGLATLMAYNVIFANGTAVSSGSTITGAFGGATATIQSVIASDPVYVNKVVIYGGSCWKNLTGNMGYDNSDTLGAWNGGLSLNSEDWELVSYQDINYYKLIENKVNYNYKFDVITYREDTSGNKVYENINNLNSIFLYGSPANSLLQNSSIIYFPWGDGAFTYNTISADSPFSMLNTFITQFSSNTISGSYFSSTYSKSAYSSFPNSVIVQSQIYGNTFNSCYISGLTGYNGNVSGNTFTSTPISNFSRTNINQCQLKSAFISNAGFIQVSISSCEGNISCQGNYGTGNQGVSFNNCKGNVNYSSNTHLGYVNFSNVDFGSNTSIQSNQFGPTTFSNNRFDQTNINSNYFYNININNNILFFTEISYNTFDASSFSGYDPQVGIAGCTNLTNNNLSFSEYPLRIIYNNFQGRSGIANCTFENNIYFNNNTFTDSKLFNASISRNSSFGDNNITSSFLERLNFNSFTFESNTFSSAIFSDNDFTGSMRLNTVTSSSITLNRGGGSSRAVLFRCTLTGNSKIQENTFGTIGSIEDCILDTGSIISTNTINGGIRNLRLSNSFVQVCTIQTEGALNLTNAGNPISGQSIIRLTSLVDDGLIAALNSSAAIFNTNYTKKLIKASGSTAKIEYFNGSGYTYTDYYNP